MNPTQSEWLCSLKCDAKYKRPLRQKISHTFCNREMADDTWQCNVLNTWICTMGFVVRSSRTAHPFSWVSFCHEHLFYPEKKLGKMKWSKCEVTYVWSYYNIYEDLAPLHNILSYYIIITYWSRCNEDLLQKTRYFSKTTAQNVSESIYIIQEIYKSTNERVLHTHLRSGYVTAFTLSVRYL